MHTIPATRKAACYGAAPEGALVEACRTELLAANGAEIDGARLAACRSAMQLATRGCDWLTPSPLAAPKECQSVLLGQRGEGEPCRSSLECRSPLHCDRTSGARTTCRPPAEAGATCGNEVDALASFVRQGSPEREHPPCKGQCSFIEHRCSEIPRIGARCYASANCGPSQLCIEGHCALGSAAKEGESCARLPCAAGLRCRDQSCRPLVEALRSPEAAALALPRRPREARSR